MRKVALIPARSGSKRIPNKNVLEFYGHPLLAYSITSALDALLFDEVVVSTDSPLIAEIAKYYGASVPALRPENLSLDLSPDIDWVTIALDSWLQLRDEDTFSILRPTNPLRTAPTISDAFALFSDNPDAQSLRAIRPVKEHPAKMWVAQERNLLRPFMPSINALTNIESHSSPLQALERLFVQDASLEVCQVWVARRLRSLTGTKVIGYVMPQYEGLDLNVPEDLEFLNFLIERGYVNLPVISKSTFG